MGFFEKYTEQFSQLVSRVDGAALEQAVERVRSTAAADGKVIVVGNGGSASIASHFSLDLARTGGIRAINFNEAGLLTCLSNDHGYEEWVERALEMYADPGDLVVLISSSGQSENILRGAQAARRSGLHLITLSGFSTDNPLRRLGDINLWVDSDVYNLVEGVHSVWLSSLADALSAPTEA